jgi:Flp pilus assembly protein TadD
MWAVQFCVGMEHALGCGVQHTGTSSPDDNGRNDKAADYFVRACELDPQNATYHASAGTAYLQREDYNRATAHLHRSVELFPEQPLTLYNLAVALLFDGKAEAAVEELAKAVASTRHMHEAGI